MQPLAKEDDVAVWNRPDAQIPIRDRTGAIVNTIKAPVFNVSIGSGDNRQYVEVLGLAHNKRLDAQDVLNLIQRRDVVQNWTTRDKKSDYEGSLVYGGLTTTHYDKIDKATGEVIGKGESHKLLVGKVIHTQDGEGNHVGYKVAIENPKNPRDKIQVGFLKNVDGVELSASEVFELAHVGRGATIERENGIRLKMGNVVPREKDGKTYYNGYVDILLPQQRETTEAAVDLGEPWDYGSEGNPLDVQVPASATRKTELHGKALRDMSPDSVAFFAKVPMRGGDEDKIRFYRAIYQVNQAIREAAVGQTKSVDEIIQSRLDTEAVIEANQDSEDLEKRIANTQDRIKKLTYEEVAKACGMNEARIFRLGRELGCPESPFKIWANVSNWIADEINRADNPRETLQRLLESENLSQRETSSEAQEEAHSHRASMRM